MGPPLGELAQSLCRQVWALFSTQAAASLGHGDPELPVLGYLPGVCPAGSVWRGCVGRSSLVGEDTFPGPPEGRARGPGGVPLRSGLSVPTHASYPLQTVFTEGPAGQGFPTSEGLCLEAGFPAAGLWSSNVSLSVDLELTPCFAALSCPFAADCKGRQPFDPAGCPLLPA